MRIAAATLVLSGVLLSGTALLPGPALAQYNNPGERAGGIYSATPGNTGMTGTGYGNVNRPTNGGVGGYGGGLTGTGITPQAPNPGLGTAPNTSVSYGSGLGAAAATGGMPQTPAPQPQRLPQLKNPQALDADQSAPAQEERGPNGAIILPRQPVPSIGGNATPQQYLQLAQQDIAARRKADAMAALEYAETRMLNRSTPYGATMAADQAPPIRDLGEARLALANNDYGTAQAIIGRILAGPNAAAGSNPQAMSNPQP